MGKYLDLELFFLLYSKNVKNIMLIFFPPIIFVILNTLQSSLYDRENVAIKESIYYGATSLIVTLISNGLMGMLIWYIMDQQKKSLQRLIRMKQLQSGLYLPKNNCNRINTAYNKIHEAFNLFFVPIDCYKTVINLIVTLYFLPTIWHKMITVCVFSLTWIIIKCLSVFYNKKKNKQGIVVFDPKNPDGYTEHKKAKELSYEIDLKNSPNEVYMRLSLGHTIKEFDDKEEIQEEKDRCTKGIIRSVLIDLAGSVIFIILLNTASRGIAQTMCSLCWVISSSAESSTKWSKIYFLKELRYLLNTLDRKQHSCMKGTKKAKKYVDKLQFRNVTFSYQLDVLTQQDIIERVIALKNFSYTFKKGTVYYITGHNGAGKTSIFKSFLYDIDNGEILFDGVNRNKYEWKSLRKMIYHLNQVNESPGLLPKHILQKMISDNKDLAKQLEIDELGEIGNDAKSGSGGQEQRINIFVALASKCPIIFLDEPFSALDIKWKERIEILLLEQSVNKIIILIGHNYYIHVPCSKQLKKLTLTSWRDNHYGNTCFA